MDIGFGLFATCTINPAAQSLQLLGVADYEYRDRHTTMQVHCTASDRAAENRTDDFVSVYGPLILLNASCPQHANLTLHDQTFDQDLGVGGKKVHVEPKAKSTIAAGRQLLLAYSPPGEQWECPGLAPLRKCHDACGQSHAEGIGNQRRQQQKAAKEGAKRLARM